MENYFQYLRDNIPNLNAILTDLSTNHPVLKTNVKEKDKLKEVWLVARYNDVKGILQNKEFGRVPDNNELNTATESKFEEIRQDWLMYKDPPKHSEIKKIASQYFNSENTEDIRKTINKKCDNAIEEIYDLDSFDFAEYVANMIPLFVISEILGIPRSDIPLLKKHCNNLAISFDNSVIPFSKQDFDKIKMSFIDTNDYFKYLLKENSSGNKKNYTSYLFRNKKVFTTEQEIISNLILIWFGGIDTTASLLSHAIVRLLTNPNIFLHIKQKPQHLPGFIEEVLRIDSPSQIVMRRALYDTVLNNTIKIKKGSYIACMIGAANLDKTIFNNPGIINPDRELANKHLSFGYGIHYCLGTFLARMESKIVFERLLSNPIIENYEINKLDYRKSIVLKSIDKLELKKVRT